MTDVTVVIGVGSIGQAIARRVSAGKHVVLADLRQEAADAAAKVLSDAGYGVTTCVVDVSSRESVQALRATGGKAYIRAEAHGDHVARHIVKQPDTCIKPVSDDINQATVRHTLNMDLRIVFQKAGHDVAYQQLEGRLGRAQTYQARRRVALGFRLRPRDGKQGSHHPDP